MSHATFELVCALCQVWLPTTHPAHPWGVTLWQAEQVALLARQQEADDAPARQALASSSPSRAPVRLDPSLGAQRSFAEGRSLRVNLTPTPTRCAPLVELTF